MANLSGVRSLEEIVKNLKESVNEARRPDIFRNLAKFSIDIIVKRTRLGYGVDKFLEPKSKLRPLADSYVKQRRKTKLNALTSAKKSNLTRTGQMLDSIKILSVSQKSAVIGPTGSRSDSSSTNEQIVAYNAEKGRVFLNLSDLEYAQVFREYRRTFGDLLKKRGLLK